MAENRKKAAFPGNPAREADTGRSVYGVYGLTEWVALISVGPAKVRIPFSGGSMSSLGVIPAVFATCDPAVKSLIERSSYFRSGRIVRVN